MGSDLQRRHLQSYSSVSLSESICAAIRSNPSSPSIWIMDSMWPYKKAAKKSASKSKRSFWSGSPTHLLGSAHDPTNLLNAYLRHVALKNGGSPEVIVNAASWELNVRIVCILLHAGVEVVYRFLSNATVTIVVSTLSTLQGFSCRT